MARDWVAWHERYDEPASSLQARLAVVQRWIRHALDEAPPGSVRVVSACAGDGRDLLGVLGDHRRAGDVRARLIELDPTNAAVARAAATDLDVTVDVVETDAGTTSAYVGAVPADLVLLCGIFGNVRDDDLRRTVATMPALCAPGATVIWTRHARPPDLTPHVRRWFADAGFEELAFEHRPPVDGGSPGFGVGVARCVGPPRPLERGLQLFTFVATGS